MSVAPDLSLVCPTARSRETCLEMCSTIKTNLDIEIIFLGPVDVFCGNTSLLSEFGGPPIRYRFVVTPVKYVQCWQIGMHLANGETVSVLNDDEKFSPYAWDNCYAMYKSANDYKTIVSMCWFEPKKQFKGITLDDLSAIPDSRWKKFSNTVFGILLPTGISVMSRKFFSELGGYDKRYVMRGADFDLFLRAIKRGASVKYCESARVFEGFDRPLVSSPTRTRKCYKIDSKLCSIKWKVENGVLIQISEDELFDFNDTILTVTQGTKGDYP